jgi:hypothetical protein
LTEQQVIRCVQQWVETVVVDLNLCPFANRELVKGRVRFAVCDAATEEALLSALQNELELLENDSAIETTLLIHPQVLLEFSKYNQFLDYTDQLLVAMELDGVYQIASFHPDYQFQGAGPDEAENYSNRSPFPMLHLLREDSLEKVIADYANVEEIPARNIAMMNDMGRERLSSLLQACLNRENK